VIEDAVRVVGNVGGLEVMVFLAENIVDSALDLERIESFVNFKVDLASLVGSPAGNFPSRIYPVLRVEERSDIFKDIRPGVFFEGA